MIQNFENKLSSVSRMSDVSNLCPYFCVGNCNYDNYPNCPYDHSRCDNGNYLCSDLKCPYGHGISLQKRKYLLEIYGSFENHDYDEDNSCDFMKHSSITCYVKNCNKSHKIGNTNDYQARYYANAIIRSKNQDEIDEIYKEYNGWSKKVLYKRKPVSTPITGMKFGHGANRVFDRHINKTPAIAVDPTDDNLSQASTPEITEGVTFCDKVKCFQAPPRIDEKSEFPPLTIEDTSSPFILVTKNKKKKIIKDPIEEIEEVEEPLAKQSSPLPASTSVEENNKITMTEEAYNMLMKELDELRKFKQTFDDLMKIAVK
tara:strand:- start:413 stop:1357 length:945 start_codon:yes stop_codon:yes gene_type:complete